MASFDKRSQKKIVDNIRYVSRVPRTVPEARRRYPIKISGSEIRFAFVTVEIDSRTDDPPDPITPGTGEITLYNHDGTLGQEGVEVQNWYDEAISVNRLVFVLNLGGHWTLLTADCG